MATYRMRMSGPRGARDSGRAGRVARQPRQDLAAEIVDRGPQPLVQRHSGSEVEQRPEPRGVAVPARLPLRFGPIELDLLPGSGQRGDPAGDLLHGGFFVGAEVRRLAVGGPLANPHQTVCEVAHVQEGAALPPRAPDG